MFILWVHGASLSLSHWRGVMISGSNADFESAGCAGPAPHRNIERETTPHMRGSMTGSSDAAVHSLESAHVDRVDNYTAATRRQRLADELHVLQMFP